MTRFGFAPLAFMSVCALYASAAPAAEAETRWCKQEWLPLTGWVVDDAGVLGPETETDLTVNLRQLERRNGHQFVIATVRSLQGRPIEEYSVCLARHWGVGRKGWNDGVMLLVAPSERKVRIEVGYGLEKILRDDEARKIIQEEIIPRFVIGDLPAGIDAGAAAIIKELS